MTNNFCVFDISNSHRRSMTYWHVWTDDSKLLQELNLTARQPCRAPHYVIQATVSEGLAQGLYVAWRLVGFEPATFGRNAPNIPLSHHVTLHCLDFEQLSFLPKVELAFFNTSTHCLRGHPFMTSTRRGERGQAQVDACGRGERGVQPHVDVHTEN